jgi:hypothetical protein
MPHIDVTNELLLNLRNAQLRHARNLVDAELKEPTKSDDGIDYLKASLALAAYLVDLDYMGDTSRLAYDLNSTQGDSALLDYASDGICEEIYALNPPALADND